MASTVDRLAQVAALLEERGVPVERRPGWRTRGREALRPAGHVEHDTADAVPLSRARMLELLAEGHGSLNNALCTWAVPRESPAAVLIAARTAWHAGRGSWEGLSGNARVTGTEIQRASGQTVTGRQWEIAAAITAAEVEVFGYDVSRVCTHNEWTPRKTDPHGLSGADWRRRVAQPQEGFLMALSSDEQEQLLDKALKSNDALGVMAPLIERMAEQMAVTEDKAVKTNHAVGDLHSFVQDLAAGVDVEMAAKRMLDRIKSRQD